MSDMPNEDELEEALLSVAKNPPLLPPGSMFPMFTAKTTCDLYGHVLVIRKENATYEIVSPEEFALFPSESKATLALSIIRKIVNDKYAYIGITDSSLIFDGQVDLTPEESALLKTLEEI